MALYHSVKGSVDYTVVGSPTIVDGVVSGFDSSNYLTLPYAGATLPQECVFTFTTGSDITSTQQTVFNNYSYRVQISSGVINCFMRLGNNLGITKTSPSISVNTKYTVKISMTSSGVGMYYKTVDSDYVTIYEGSEVVVPVSSSGYIGHYDLTTQSFLGSIDLNSTYIKVDGQAWFGVCPVEVKKHQIMGPVGYTKVGNPTIVDGVVSGFSGSDYLKTSLPFNPHSSNWELVCSFIYQQSAGLFGSTTGHDYQGITLVFNNNKLRWCLSSTGLSWDIVGARIAGESLQNGVKYKVKISYNGIQYNLFLSTENSDYILIDSQISSTPIFESSSGIGFGNNYIGANQFFNGSIDLKSTYIKVNGTLWFYQPAPTKYIIHEDKDTHNQSLVFASQDLYLAGPNSYTKVGSPVIEDGVASGFSNNNYLYIPSPTETVTSFEAVFDFTTGDSWQTEGNAQTIWGNSTNRGHAPLISIENDGTLRILLPGSSHTWSSLSSLENFISLNTRYVLKLSWDGTNLSLNKKVNDSWISVFEKSFGSLGWDDQSRLGTDTQSVNYLLGSIDLNQTYIKVNGQLWFYGKNYASKNIAPVPAGYTFGNTTTPSIGYVDMRTQAFTAAPSGATIGRDE